MLYFHIVDDEISLGPVPLPTAFGNTSGFHLQSVSELKARGWLPEELVGFEPFDPATQNRSGPVHSILPSKVRSRYVVTPKTPQELADVQRQADLSTLRAATKDAVIIITALVDALLTKGVIVATDVEPIARQAYQDLKVLADRVKS